MVYSALDEYFVVPGLNSIDLAGNIASRLGCRIASVYRKQFPDGELYVRIGERVSKSVVVIVNSFYPRQDSSIIETLLLVNAVRYMNAYRIIAVIPYLAYSRQDKIFMDGEPVSIEAILKSLKACGVDYLLTVDLHNPLSLKYFGEHGYNIMVSDLLVRKALDYLEKPIVLAPDKGALERASYAAKELGLDYDYLVKRRDRVSGKVSLEPKEINVSGRDVVIVDDIISTGGTIALASKKCLESGANRVVVAATHSLLIGSALEKIMDADVYKLITTNSISLSIRESFIEVVDLSERIAEAVKNIV